MAAPPGIKAPIGTGPWRLANSQLNQRDVLVRNERYWGRKPALQQITIKVIPDATSRAVAFETGEIDMLYGDEGLLPLDTFERFRHHPGYVARLSAPAETVMLALNASQGPTREQAVREALNYAVDKQTLVDSVLYGTQQVADTLFAPSVPYAPQDLTPRRYDPTKARALLEQAGWQQLEGQPRRQKAGQPLAIELAFIGTDALAKSMAEIIQANLRQVGVQVTLVGEEESSIYARQREGRFGMIFNRTWGAPYDPHAFLSSMRVPSHADYRAQRGLPDKALIDKEISEVLTTGDEAQRRKLYHDVLTRLHQDAVYLPISYVSLMSVARRGRGDPVRPGDQRDPFRPDYPGNAIMLRYILRRLLLLIPLLLAASAIIFLLLRLGAGDPALDYLRLSNLPPTEEMVASTRELLGLNQPLAMQYLHWLWRALHWISVSPMPPSARCWTTCCTSCRPPCCSPARRWR